MQNCCKSDSLCQWSTPIFRATWIKKPLNRSTSNLMGVIMSGTSLQVQTSVFLSLSKAGLHLSEIVIIRVYFFTPPLLFLLLCAPVEIAPWPFNRFSWLMAQKTCFCVIFVVFGVRTQNVIFSTIFRKNTRNSLFPQCKTSIGNNSSSIEDRAVQFAYSTGFSVMADRTVWSSSLSRDRKWPCPPIRRKTTPWRRVTP